ncbi:MAG: hypothetical protein Q7T16_02380 [Candidatus Burarchaeum sp.]|nr:hypothetical protein [Candidatus Burarchaeum sp.]MDO8339481.1 hypothetical protein [Candidatus Burarchaeum sp.]
MIFYDAEGCVVTGRKEMQTNYLFDESVSIYVDLRISTSGRPSRFVGGIKDAGSHFTSFFHANGNLDIHSKLDTIAKNHIYYREIIGPEGFSKDELERLNKDAEEKLLKYVKSVTPGDVLSLSFSKIDVSFLTKKFKTKYGTDFFKTRIDLPMHEFVSHHRDIAKKLQSINELETIGDGIIFDDAGTAIILIVKIGKTVYKIGSGSMEPLLQVILSSSLNNPQLLELLKSPNSSLSFDFQ